MASDASTQVKPVCVASTNAALNVRIGVSSGGQNSTNNFFREAKFTNDGTTVIALNDDQTLRTYVLPVELLEDRQEPHDLRVYSAHRSASNIHSYAIYPHYDLQNTATTVVLASSAHVPLTLRNGLHFDTVHCTYPWINPSTEEFLSARSLAFTPDGSHFVAGGENVLAVFDASRDGSGPTISHKLKHRHRSGREGLRTVWPRGHVTALDMSTDGILAVGTQSRDVALLDQMGAGGCITSFSVAAEKDTTSGRGSGVMHIKWSPDGQYLLVAERQSDSILVFDVRNTGKRVAVLGGRKADTTQRLGFDVTGTQQGYEVWAGGVDGSVRMWNNPGAAEGVQEPNATLGLHNSPVASAAWHPGGSVLLTCSGARTPWALIDEDAKSKIEPDNTLKVWTL